MIGTICKGRRLVIHALKEEMQAREELTAELSELRTKLDRPRSPTFAGECGNTGVLRRF
jgi:hypothetical protein